MLKLRKFCVVQTTHVWSVQLSHAFICKTGPLYVQASFFVQVVTKVERGEGPFWGSTSPCRSLFPLETRWRLATASFPSKAILQDSCKA